MRFAVLIMLGLAVTYLLTRLRNETRAQRLEVTARVKAELAERPSPTADLFREYGVPVPEPVVAEPAGAAETDRTDTTEPVEQIEQVEATVGGTAPTPDTIIGQAAHDTLDAAIPSVPTHVTTDLTTFVEGVQLPCGLWPVGMESLPGIQCSTATFATTLDQMSALNSALADEFERIGCSVTWVDALTAQLHRGDAGATISIVSDAEADRLLVRVAAV